MTRARHTEKDIHRWVFACNMAPDVKTLVRKWLITRLDGFYCDLQVMYTPPLHAMARTDEALIKATRLNPHMLVCGWPFCLDDLDGVNDAKGGAA